MRLCPGSNLPCKHTVLLLHYYDKKLSTRIRPNNCTNSNSPALFILNITHWESSVRWAFIARAASPTVLLKPYSRPCTPSWGWILLSITQVQDQGCSPEKEMFFELLLGYFEDTANDPQGRGTHWGLASCWKLLSCGPGWSFELA